MTTGIKNWSTTPGDNDSTSPNGFPEGMAPSQVNDSARQVMAEVRDWYEDASWIDLGLSGLTYVDSDTFRLTGDQTAIFTVNRRVRAIGTTPFTIYGTITASTFDSTNTDVDVTWDSGSLDNTLSEVAIGPEVTNKPISSAGIEFLDNTIPAAAVAGFGVTGDYKYSAQAASHNGWLLCDGSAISRTTYSALFALIGTAFGTGDGSTTFNLPDGRGRMLLGAGQGDTAEGGGTGTDRSIGDEGGAETHTLTEAELAEHTHDIVGISSGGSLEGLNTSSIISSNRTLDGARPTQSAGSDNAHNNMPPFVVGGNLFIFSSVIP